MVEQFPLWQKLYNNVINVSMNPRLLMSTSPWTPPPHPGGSIRRHKKDSRLFYPRMLKASQSECRWKHSRPQRARSLWSALRIAITGQSAFSKHGQSICFVFLANKICQIWREVRGVFWACSDNRVWPGLWPEVAILSAKQKERGRMEIRMDNLFFTYV